MTGIRHAVERITARVFCQLEGSGGNPLTIFKSASKLAASECSSLAQTCEWESVMVSKDCMNFYMPTGEEVSFCAHAAMGGATQLAIDNQSPIQFMAEKQGKQYKAQIHDKNIVSLDMQCTYEETIVPHSPSLYRLLRECHDIQTGDMVQKYSRFPTFLNASIVRPKTMVYVNSLDALHRAKPPPQGSDIYRNACDSIETTGLYLYTFHEGEWHCRQFPRASGYPEDAATGIAAAALAVCMHRRGVERNVFNFIQGASSESVLAVDAVNTKDFPNVSFRLMGKVELEDSVKL